MITCASHLNIPLQKNVPPMPKKEIINRDVITDIIYSHFGYCRESVLQNAIDELIDYFNDISVDKQKIIRCKNCIHGRLEDDGDYLCTSTGCTWNEKDFYCKDGEQKNER